MARERQRQNIAHKTRCKRAVRGDGEASPRAARRVAQNMRHACPISSAVLRCRPRVRCEMSPLPRQPGTCAFRAAYIAMAACSSPGRWGCGDGRVAATLRAPPRSRAGWKALLAQAANRSCQQTTHHATSAYAMLAARHTLSSSHATPAARATMYRSRAAARVVDIQQSFRHGRCQRTGICSPTTA